MMKRTVFLSSLVPQVSLSKAYKIDTGVFAWFYCKELRVLVAYSSSVEENITEPIYILAHVLTA